MNRYHRNESERLPEGYRDPLWSDSGLELMMVLRERTAEIRNEQDRQTEISLAAYELLRDLPDRVATRLKETKSEPTREGSLGALLRLVLALKELAETIAPLKELAIGILIAALSLRGIALPDEVRGLLFGSAPRHVEGKSSGEP